MFSSILSGRFTDILLPIVLSAGIYGGYRLVLYIYELIQYRLLVQFELDSESHNRQWTWLQSFLRHHPTLANDLHYWTPESDWLHPTDIQATHIPLRVCFRFEGKQVRLRIYDAMPNTMRIQQYHSEVQRRIALLWTRNVDPLFFSRFLQYLKKEYTQLHHDRLDLLTPILGGQNQGMNNSRSVARRSLDSVTLKAGIKEKLVADLQHFIRPETRAHYEAHGRSYHRGWLFVGPPGNGKSSTILALASSLGSEVLRVSLDVKDMDDQALYECNTASPLTDPPRFIYFEDIDCLFKSREKGESVETQEENTRSRVTLSGFLNVLDGLGSAENAIFILTTNYPDKLDPALMRPGRVDCIFRFDPPDDATIVRHYLTFYPDSQETLAFVNRCREHPRGGQTCCMALVQELLFNGQ